MNTDKKAVFFDADGTICDIEKGVPDSAVEAIRKLRENGHRKKQGFCPGLSGTDPVYRYDQRMRRDY